MKNSSRINESHASRSKHDDDEDNDSFATPTTKLIPEDNVESSSTGSEGGKGTGSGGGYSADCSSSDASSDDAANRTVPLKEMKHLTVSGDKRELKSKRKDPETRQCKKSASSGIHFSSQAGAQHDLGDQPKIADQGFDLNGENDTALPQWNGIRILHPMDPRIDLSTVDHIRTSSLSAYSHNPPPESIEKHDDDDDDDDDAVSGIGVNQVAPSIDQYMNLMEIVRPFFHAHGMSLLESPTEKEPLDHRSSELEIERSDVIPRMATAALEQITDSQTLKQAVLTGSGMIRLRTNDGSNESDCSSMVVLARVKRKHLLNRSADDPADDGSNNSSHAGSNTTSNSSSEKRVRIQQPFFRDDEESKTEENSPGIEHENDADIDREIHVDREIRNEDEEDRQESASSSSSESRNNADAPPNGPMGFGVPAVVSEYSSSRVGSSGASNTNQMSTSGSGSAGNTGSGTGSGSNQGGSSGSGNDQGGISSAGNGSSASGNDVKGSSEEMMDNSAENNSGEGNSDATNSNNERTSNDAVNASQSAYCTGHRHYPTMDDSVRNDHDCPILSNFPSNKINSNAVRERKLQDKKRKRHLMRREYEEKVQQEMESSEGSRDCEESTHIKPGRPVTLDKVLSFTKVPRIVVSANPPFLVVHTNAAYCRLSGIDSHAVIGKPISILLSIPDIQTLEEVTQEYKRPQERVEDNPDFQSTTYALLENHYSNQDGEGSLFQTDASERQRLTAAEAAGRARGAASQVDSIERLIATSGLGRWSIINLNAKPLLDPNLVILKPPETLESRNHDDGSSVASKCEGSYRPIACSMGVSPVVSSPEAFTVVTDKDQEIHHQKSKRRKHHQSDSPNQTSPHPQQLRRNYLHREISMHRKRHLITHFLIQLQPIEAGSRQLSSLESQSSMSTAAEAQMLGMTTSELRIQRGRVESTAPIAANELAQESDDDDEFLESESSSHLEAVTAVG